MPKTSRGAIRGLRSTRGQGLVEFALVLPLLMIFLLGVADFGRVFADGIALEAAARNTAEAVAEQYLQLCNKYPAAFCGNGLQAPDYAVLHTLAADIGCRESKRLTTLEKTGSACTNPVIALCVHDNTQGDTACGQGASGASASCTRMAAAWSPIRAGPVGGRPYAEVRMCYRFDPLFTFGLGSWGTVWLQKANTFAVTNY